ncbi:MAG: DUF2809 domain-containing protein [Kofleriaceae bacterium]
MTKTSAATSAPSHAPSIGRARAEDAGPRRTARGYALLGAGAIAFGGIVLLYRGPGQPFVRGHVGDVAATMLVFAIVSLVWMRIRAWRARAGADLGGRALVTMAIATAIEVAQVWFHATSTAGHLVLGSTFDWIDLVAYAVGVGIAVVWEHRGDHRSARS